MTYRLTAGHRAALLALLLIAAGIAADYRAVATSGGSLKAVRSGEAGNAQPTPMGNGGEAAVAYCGFAPCGMPIRCRTPGQ